MHTKYLSVIAVVILLTTSCKKRNLDLAPSSAPASNSAFIKIVHASAYSTNYTVNLKVNNERVSNNLTYSTPFPGGGLNTGGSNVPWYLSVNPGANQLGLVAVRTSSPTVDSATLYNGSVNLGSNKYYSAYIADTTANSQVVLVNENVAVQPLGKTRFKFVNLIPNVSALDLYVGTNVVASNIPYKGVSPDFTLNTSDTVRFYIRPAGSASTSNPVSTYPALSPFAAAFAVPNGRLMTVFTRGYSGTTGNRAPAISLLYN